MFGEYYFIKSVLRMLHANVQRMFCNLGLHFLFRKPINRIVTIVYNCFHANYKSEFYSLKHCCIIWHNFANVRIYKLFAFYLVKIKIYENKLKYLKSQGKCIFANGPGHAESKSGTAPWWRGILRTLEWYHIHVKWERVRVSESGGERDEVNLDTHINDAHARSTLSSRSTGIQERGFNDTTT